MRRTAFVAVTFFAFVAMALGQTTAPAHRTPSLVARDGDKTVALALAKADIQVDITGYIAETTVTLTFKNSGSRPLEGELDFPLPEGATVSGYGLDVNGRMVDGVPVEKEKARVTYEQESRKQIDPGLVEHTMGNNFHTRVYPIPANGTRTVRVQFLCDLVETAKGATLRLPLDWNVSADDGTLRITATGSPGQPAASGGDEAAGLVFEKHDLTFIAEKSLKNVTINNDLVVALPQIPRQSIMVEKRASQTIAFDDLVEGRKARVLDRPDHYFVIEDHPPMDFNAHAESPIAHRIGILWDAGLTRADSDKTAELNVLRAVLAKLDPAATVDVVVFRDTAEKARTFFRGEGDDKIIAFLQSVIYDGASRFDDLAIHGNLFGAPGPAADGKPAPYAYWLLFSDGRVSLGQEMPSALESPVYTISNDARSNHPLLRRIASQSGGQYLNLQRLSAEQAAATIGVPPYALIGVDAPKDALAEVLPHPGTPVNGRVTITGLLKADSAEITLKYGIGGVVLHTQSATLTRQGATDGGDRGLVGRLWAQRKVADLSADVDANADALAVLGREFNMVTPNTSLLVLETVDQYLAHRVVPPKSRDDVYAQFMDRIEQQKTAVAKTREEKLTQVAAMWAGRVQWWETPAVYAKDFKFAVPAPAPVAAAMGEATVTGTPAGGQANMPDALPRPAEPRTATGHGGAGGSASSTDIRAQFMDAAEARSTANYRAQDLLAMASASLYPGSGREAETSSNVAAIAIKAWDPKVPYLAAMREAGKAEAYAVFLKQRSKYSASPAFYMDCADWLLQNGESEKGLRVLSDILALKLDNAPLLRVAAARFNQAGQLETAIELYEKILKLRPEEPQSYRDLALALADRADGLMAKFYAKSDFGRPEQRERALSDYQRSLELLNKVVVGQWDNRFQEIELPVLMEANRILTTIKRIAPNDADSRNPLDARLVKLLDLDVRIVLTWDADLTDVDLWVIEPSGEKCVYNHNRTTIGGLLSHDFTQGYGPEEYCLRKAMPGEYKIQANYYGSQEIALAGPITVHATVITHFGRPDEERKTLTLRLDQAKDVVDVGNITIN